MSWKCALEKREVVVEKSKEEGEGWENMRWGEGGGARGDDARGKEGRGEEGVRAERRENIGEMSWEEIERLKEEKKREKKE